MYSKFDLKEWVGKGSKNLLLEETQGPELPTVRDITFKLITDVFVKPHIHNSPTIGNRPFTLSLEIRAKSSKKTFDAVVRELGLDSKLDNLNIEDIMDKDNQYLELAQELSAVFWQKLIFDEYGDEYTIPQEALDFRIIPGDANIIKDLSAEEIAHKFGIPLQMLKDFNLDPDFLSGDQDTVEISSAFHDFLHDMLVGVINKGDRSKLLQFNNFKTALQKATGTTIDYVPNTSSNIKTEVMRLWDEINSKINLINVDTKTEVPYQPSGEEVEATYHIIVPYFVPSDFFDSNGRNLASKGNVLSGEFTVKGFDFSFDTLDGLKLNFDKNNLTDPEQALIDSILKQSEENYKSSNQNKGKQDSQSDNSSSKIDKKEPESFDKKIDSSDKLSDTDISDTVADVKGWVFDKFNLEDILNLFT